MHAKLALLRNVRAKWSNEDLIELIIYGIKDYKVKESASMRDFNTISKLISILSTCKKLNVPSMQNNDSYRPPAKRPHPEEIKRHNNVNDNSNKRLKCYKCGSINHLQRNCPSLGKTNSNHSLNNNSFTTQNCSANNEPSNLPSGSNKCNFCFKTGHIEGKCFLKDSIEKRRKAINLTKLVQENRVTANKVIVDGNVYMGLIDTGADISLMSDTFIDKFRHKLKKL